MKSFEELPISKQYADKLKERNIIEPSPIQKLVIPRIAIGWTTLFTSPTGSGKTLAYLLPLLTQLDKSNEPFQALLIVPSRELAHQIQNELFHLVGNQNHLFKSLLSGPSYEQDLEDIIVTSPKIVVTMPKALWSLLQDSNYSRLITKLHGVKTLIMDEADKILKPLSSNANPILKEKRRIHPTPGSLCLNYFNKLGHPVQLVAVSATFNSALRGEIGKLGWKEKNIIHHGEPFRSPEGLSHYYTFIGENQKMEKLVEIFRRFNLSSTLVFIHPNHPIEEFVSTLKTDYGLNAVALHTQVDPKIWGQFLERFRKGEIQVVVTTEAAARGLDFEWLTHVFLLYSPQDIPTYLHLAGRTARFGRRGTAISIITSAEHKRLSKFENYGLVAFTNLIE